MSKFKFLGLAAALMLMAGCTVPLGYYGGYGGYGGYSGNPYGSSYPSPQYGYPNVAGVPYGNPGIDPYYGYQNYGYQPGPVASGPPVVIDNHIPTPYPGINSTDPTMPGGESPYWRRHARRHPRYRNGNIQEDLTGTDPTLTPGTNSTDSATAGMNRRQRQLGNHLANQQGTESPQQQNLWGNQRYNRQGSQFSQQQASQRGQLANSQGFPFGQRQPQMANQQRFYIC